jgi:CheY-like chemotaxis protein
MLKSPLQDRFVVDPQLAILLVSNNQMPAQFFEKAMKAAGFRNLTVTTSGIAAFEYLKGSSFKLLIADMDVRYIDGWRLIKEVKNSESLPNIPAMLIGSKPCPIAPAELKEYGVADYLQLPAVPKLMLNVLLRTLQESAAEKKYSAAKSSVVANHAAKAIPLYKEIRANSNSSNRSIIGLAQAYVANDQPSEARETINEVKGIEYAAIDLQLRDHLSQGNAVAAATIIDALIKEAETPTMVLVRCARHLYEADQASLCERLSKHALTITPDISNLWLYLAKSQKMLNLLDDMKASLKQYEKRFGESNQSLNLLATSLRSEGKIVEAIKAYKKALSISPRNIKLMYNLALCQLEAGMVADAKAELLRCLEYQSDFELAQELLKKLEKGA